MPEPETAADALEPVEDLEAREGSPPSRGFGEEVVSSNPLDEVVLDYLVENARKRKRSAK